MATERIRLTVKEVSEPKAVGDKGAKKLSFKATNPEGKELSFFSFSTRLFEHIKAGAVIEADVDTTTSEHGGNTYTDRKVMQIYVEGQAVSGQRQGGDWVKPDNTASIEAQTAFKGVMDLAGRMPTNGDKLTRALDLALNWAIEKLSVISATPALVKENLESVSIKETEKPAGLNRVAGIDMDWLKESLAKLQLVNPQLWSNVAVIYKLNRITGVKAKSITEAVRPLNAKQAQEFGKEVEEALSARV